MNIQQQFRQAFSHLHASTDTLQEVCNMATQQTKSKHSARRIIIMAATLALLVSMTLVAYATGLISNIFAVLTPSDNPGTILTDIYSDQISADKPYMEDYLGNPIARPDMERIALDPQAAEDMVGAYVSTAQGTFTVGNNTFSLCTFMIDKMGTGAFTWTVENSNGIYYKSIGYGMVDFTPASPFHNPVLTHTADDTNSLCDTFTFLIKEENNSTKLHLVTFFSTTSTFTPGDALIWQVKDDGIQIAPVNYMPVKTLTDGNIMTVSVSHQGLVLDAHSKKEIVPHKIEIQFTDGTKYLLMDKENYNISGSLWRQEGEISYDQLAIVFNRLIDPENIASIEFEYTWRETLEHNGTLESILHTEHSTFLP